MFTVWEPGCVRGPINELCPFHDSLLAEDFSDTGVW